LSKDATHATNSAVSAIDSQSENYQSTDTVKQYYNPNLFVRQTKKCLSLKKEQSPLYRNCTWQEISL
jgi:hypothetical protein